MIKDSVFYEVEYEGTRWGGYDTIIHYNRIKDMQTKLKRLFIEPNKNLSYQRHEHRSESWIVFDGSGTLVLDDNVYSLSVGSTIIIPEYSWHAVKAGEKGLEIVEVQYGEKVEEDDIERMFYDWNEIIDYVKKVKEND